ncbi:hypothetical protein Tco_1180563 [Tanacetum coccineum]
MFVDFRTELVKGSSNRAGTKLEQKVTKKQKVDDVQETTEVDNDQEAAKINELMEIVPGRRLGFDLHVGRKEVSPCTIYTFIDVRKEASN